MSDTSPESDSYIAAVRVFDMFVDHSYQRELEHGRATQMSVHWSPRLAGVLDVSDRGEGASPRYAIINGQHRWAATKLRDPSASMAANVHTGLTRDGEARLFFDIDSRTKALTTWDRWHARGAAGDKTVIEVERVVRECGLEVTQHPGEKNIQCCATLERVWTRSGSEVLAQTILLITDVWPGIEDAVKSTIVEAIALMLDYYDRDLDSGRLADAMSEFVPKQLHARAKALQEQGTKGTFPYLISDVLRERYNRGGTPKLKNIRELITAHKVGGAAS